MEIEREKDVHNTWNDVDDYPKEHVNIVVKDRSGREYNDHQWVGHAYYDFIGNDEDGYDGWRTDVDIVSWRYQDEPNNH